MQSPSCCDHESEVLPHVLRIQDLVANAAAGEHRRLALEVATDVDGAAGRDELRAGFPLELPPKRQGLLGELHAVFLLIGEPEDAAAPWLDPRGVPTASCSKTRTSRPACARARAAARPMIPAPMTTTSGCPEGT